MPVEVNMPKLSDTMEEGKILKWLKAVGDRVQPGDVIAEVETDKADMDLEAFDEGVLSEVRVAEGQSAPVGAVIAVLAAGGEKVDAPKERSAPSTTEAKAEPAPAADKAVAAQPRPAREPARAEREAPRPILIRRAEPPPAAQSEGARVRVSPLARRVAREHGVDPAQLRGTGPGGRVVERDVQAAVTGGGRQQPAEAAQPAETAPTRAAAAASAGRRVELPRIRRTTARRMFEAKRDVPHFYVSSDVLMDEASRLKADLVALGDAWKGLTVTHLLLKAVGLALQRVPEMNASPDGDSVILHEVVNVGLATAVEGGLVVPVVRNCDATPLAEIARSARALVERARAGKFAADDLTGATFTVSNLGMLPVSEFAAIINQPQAGILAVGAVRAVPVVRDGQVVPGQVMTVTLSADHRIVDGMLAGRFLAELKALLERPVALLV
jgi:pyruvate dehydrogenase E2 component (dihydrolipoamide acetyltransferase)